MRQRRELFEKEEITASAVQREIRTIFEKLQQRIRGRITIMSIEHYRRRKLRGVRLLQDDESLFYVFEQLSRHITFTPNMSKVECDSNLLKEILCENISFGDEYEIDEETIPKMVRKNEKYIEDLHHHLIQFYDDTDFEHHHKNAKMTVGDALSIVILYQRMFMTMEHKINDSADEYVVNQDIFCKFVDSSFNVEDDIPGEWSKKTKSAINLYQSVLDHLENFVTLGQVRQTVCILASQIIEGMGAGKLSRLLNHISKRANNDAERCVKKKRRLVTNGTSKRRLRMDKAAKESSPLKFEHIRGKKWCAFVAQIADHFSHDVKSRTMYQQVSSTSDEDTKDSLFEAMLDMTHFDVKIDDTEQEVKPVSDRDAKRTRLAIFDTMLSEAVRIEIN